MKGIIIGVLCALLFIGLYNSCELERTQECIR